MTHDDSLDGAVDDGGAAVKSECVRRSVLRGAVVLGAVGIGGALSRVGASSSGAASLTSAQGSTPATGTGASAAPASGGAVTGATNVAKKGRSLGPASKVPVGGGVIFQKAQVVVTQPTAGVFKAFDAMCTHQKCLVTEVTGGTINCPCHGAKFSITDGTVVSFFPITDDLPAKGTVTVAGGKVVWAS